MQARHRGIGHGMRYSGGIAGGKDDGKTRSLPELGLQLNPVV